QRCPRSASAHDLNTPFLAIRCGWDVNALRRPQDEVWAHFVAIELVRSAHDRSEAESSLGPRLDTRTRPDDGRRLVPRAMGRSGGRVEGETRPRKWTARLRHVLHHPVDLRRRLSQ